MNIIEILLIAVSLAADAFCVALAKGTKIKNVLITDAFKIAFMFGFFQYLMPVLGTFIGESILTVILSFSNLVTAFILAVIGVEMLKNSNEDINQNEKTTILSLILPALLTSIDALAVGIGMSAFSCNILLNSAVIGITAFIFSYAGTFIGNKFGLKSGKYAEISGSIILILLSFKFLFEHFR